MFKLEVEQQVRWTGSATVAFLLSDNEGAVLPLKAEWGRIPLAEMFLMKTVITRMCWLYVGR